MKPAIFKAYDIRGLYPQELDAPGALAIGRAVARKLGPGAVAVGFDMRTSADALREAFVTGLRSEGADVIDIGRVATPILYFATTTLGAVGGAMITASHNPGAYNGFKLCGPRAVPIGIESGLRDIRDAALAFEGQPTPAARGSLRSESVKDRYYASLLELFPARPRLRAVIDAGNGIAGEAYGGLIDRLPLNATRMYFEPDGSFPNHEADPLKHENLEDLQRAVRAEGADLGIAFDGDGDRIGVVDGKGRILWGDQLMVLLAGDIIKTRPGATIIADVKASQVLFDEIARMGGTPLMWRTGHSLIKTKMAETGAPLAGEMSGHIFFADRYYGYDDALYAAVRLLGIVARGTTSVAEMRDRLPAVVNTPELRFPCSETRKFAAIDEVRARLRQAGAEMSDIDGVRVRTPDGWWLLRASNTQDVLVARAEARDEAGLNRLKALLVEELSR
ncbi:MAG: phosphomannomutase/phosphoglucomutase, partial [bacterium]